MMIKQYCVLQRKRFSLLLPIFVV